MALNLLPGEAVVSELVDHIAALHQACFTPGWNVAAFEGLLGTPGMQLILATDDAEGSLDGLLMFRAVTGEAEIITLCVHPSKRGRGGGAKLVESMVSQMHPQGISVYFLEVAETNLPAIRLYEACGFVEVGRRKAYYADGETAIIMRRADKV